MKRPGLTNGNGSDRSRSRRPKRHSANSTSKAHTKSAGVVYEQVEQLTRELAEAHEHQVATADLLKVISGSGFDLQAVLDTLIESCTHLCGAKRGHIFRFDGMYLRFAAAYGAWPGFIEYLQNHPVRVGAGSISGRAASERRTLHIHDVTLESGYEYGDLIQQQGYRTVLAVPMLRGRVLLGVIMILKTDVAPFSEKQIELVTTFADQAVIAIETVRLFTELESRNDELAESLERQTATSDILRAISGAPNEVQPVFDAIVRNAVMLCGSLFANVFRFDGERLHLGASHNVDKSYVDLLNEKYPLRPNRSQVSGRAILERSVIRIEDALSDPDYDKRFPAAGKWRRMLGVPLVREQEVIGVIVVGWREPGPVSPRHEELLLTFADQAVIAIENARLFEEVQARTRDLAEALEQQTATGDILRVISSSPTDVQPVFDMIAERAAQLCRARFCHVFQYEGDLLQFISNHGLTPEARNAAVKRWPRPPNRGSAAGRAVLDANVVEIPDVDLDSDYDMADLAEVIAFRSIVGVPILRDGAAVGAITVMRAETGSFPDRQVALLKTFADQAVIAVDNVRLFTELESRNRDLGDALERQTATSKVLGVISRSTFDLKPVLDTIVETAAHLCRAEWAVIHRLRDDGAYHLAADARGDEAMLRYLTEHPVTPGRGKIIGRTVLEAKIVHVQDVLADPEYEWSDAQQTGGYRTVLGVPLLREGVVIGVIALARNQVKPLTESEIDLVATFADQAVIAIENARLLGDLRDSLEQQTATSEVLKVISRSAFNLPKVLNTVLDSAAQLGKADIGTLRHRDGDIYRLAATFGCKPEWHADFERYSTKPDRGSVYGRTMIDGRTIHIPDVTVDPEFTRHEAQKLMGFRAALGVPLLREGEAIGALILFRFEPLSFTQQQIELVETFADQAVIAIENARLLSELRSSLEQQTATSNVLTAISRSTFDLPTVLSTLVEAAARLCEADHGTIAREQDGSFRRMASHGYSAQFDESVINLPVEHGRGSATGRALAEGQIVHIPDVEEDQEYTFAAAKSLGGFRTILAVPMLREGTAIGALALTRKSPRPFTERQIDLVTTFADQAAIAIENVRLFESAEARARELAKSLDELRVAQDRLVQTEKLASLGQLTAGIAHEIKNPLNFVTNFASLSTELVDELAEGLDALSLSDDDRADIDDIAKLLQGNLEKIREHGNRADSIVKNMLQHARQGTGERRLVKINALVEESMNLAFHGARAERPGFEITLNRNFDEAAGEVNLYPQEITRVLLNFLSNSFHATAQKRNVEANDYEPIVSVATRDRGNMVEITIHDNGTGIPPNVKERLFSPFFTTKPAGEGTGLGLSISHDIIVKQHAGAIEVDTQPGEFTEFRILLPRAIADPSAAQP